MEMLDKAVFVTALLAALGAGLMAGLFFIFSNTIMRSLGRLPSADGMAAMQSINTTIQNPLFLGVFMGAGLLSVLAIIFAFVDWRYSSSVFLIAGGIFYLAGSLLVTMVFNVPMNKALDAAVPGDAGARLWQDYLINWTRWNHMRALACLFSSASFILALAYRGAR